MPFSQSLDRKIETLRDLAEVVGLNKHRECDEILSSILRSTDYDVEASLDIKDITFAHVEKWQIEVTKTRSKPVIRVRSGNRGSWSSGSADIPPEVLGVLALFGCTISKMKTNRSFSAWEQGGWSPYPCRRLKSGANTLLFCVTLPEVQRRTGHQVCHLILSPFGDEGEVVVAALEMPFRVSDLSAAIEQIKARYAAPPAAA